MPTVQYRVLFVFIMLTHERRRIIHFNVTRASDRSVDGPADRRSVSLGTAPRYLLRDRDSIYGAAFQNRVCNLGLEDVKIMPQSPWQNPYCERVIGRNRRDALDHVIVLNEQHLHRVLRSYVDYDHPWRTPLSLEMDTPASRAVQPLEFGSVRKRLEVGGLHHHYERMAAEELI